MNTITPHTAGRLAGRHALVTGAGSGIGAAIAMALAADGACVTLAGRMRDKLDRAAATLKDPARHGVVTLDVTDVRSVAEGLRQAEAERGPLDILVCNAGAAPSAPFDAHHDGGLAGDARRQSHRRLYLHPGGDPRAWRRESPGA